MHPLIASRLAARQPAPPPAPLTDLVARLTVLFPDFDALRDAEVRDDGAGPHLAAWHRPEPQPTAEELRAVVLPEIVRTWAPLDFFERLADAEKAAVVSSDDTQVRIIRLMFGAATLLHSDDPRFLAGLNHLVSLGILTAERKVALLAS
jgi:hypothetical protein